MSYESSVQPHSDNPSYRAFGLRLAELRRAAGIAHQAELAKRVSSTQQTVSRWEAGVSRPRVKQIPLIASVLGYDANELLRVAGYIAPQVVATFDQHFPLEALTPNSFERFCLYFLSKKYPDADVHRAGGPGHTQDGLDVEAIFSDGRCYTFQCKRVDTFGPKKVRAVVEAHIRKAEKQFILLSRVASPQAREAIRQNTNWDIWDREDISRCIRELSRYEQIKLVDTFFKGQQLALLGESEPGPWQTTEEFFAAFMSGRGAFHHKWNLVGRSDETAKLVLSLSDSTVQAVFLTGSGGSGKSRVLKEAVELYMTTHDATVVFLSPSEEVTNKSLEDLGDGEKILVVDDAHDRNDLRLLFQFVAIPVKTAKLLLSFRPYGLTYIKAQASDFTISGDHVTEIRLNTLDINQSTALAYQVLEDLGGPLEAAEQIARLTHDCPLATVMGAQVVANDKRHVALIANEDTFRSTLFGKFQNIIAGEIGAKTDADPIRRILRLLALVQPFYPEDASLASAIEEVEKLPSYEFKRIVRLLSDAGVLFRRGGKYRLSPDLLGDYIIERECLDQGGGSTGYAEKVFDAAGNAHIQSLLLNLGKLDWRRANGNPSNSCLLNGIWAKLKPTSEYSDPHIKAVSAVAFYQPGKALDFAETLIRRRNFLRDVPNILKQAAYNCTHMRRACECLWELGKADDRNLHQNPSHAIRILGGLCAVEPNKPIEYNEIAVNFGLALLEQEDAWSHSYTPFDFLSGILRAMGTTSTSNGKNVSWGTFWVTPKVVAPLRLKVIDATLELLIHSNIKIAALAASFLQKAIQYPMNARVEISDQWAKEFISTLEKIEDVIRSNTLDPLVLFELLRSVSWHAHSAGRGSSTMAHQIIALMPETLEFRTLLALANGYGLVLGRLDFAEREKEVEARLEMLTHDLLSAYADREELRGFIEKSLIHIDANATSKDRASSVALYWKLIQASPEFARTTIENAITHAESRTAWFAGIALGTSLKVDHAGGLDIARRFLAKGMPALTAAVGRAYSYANFSPENYQVADFAIISQLFGATDEIVILNALRLVRTLLQIDRRITIDMLLHVDLSISDRVANETLMFFDNDTELPFNALTQGDVETVLGKLSLVPELNGHWVNAFLSEVSKTFPMLCAAFFMRRVEHASVMDSWSFRPCNCGPYAQTPLRFREAADLNSLLGLVAQWMNSRDYADYHFRHCARELFGAMFSPFDEVLVGFLSDWLAIATRRDIQAICDILCEAHQFFIFEHNIFVVRLMEKAILFGSDIMEKATDSLYRAAISGIKSGTVGEPFPQDVAIKENAVRILKEMPRFSPAFELYEGIRKSAERNINQKTLIDEERFEE